MKSTKGLLWVGLTCLLAQTGIAQEQIQHQHRPAIAVTADPSSQKQPQYEYFSILDGTPQGLVLHHDTEVGTGKPVDVYLYPIELQVLNSDGNLEPEGLILDNFYTAKAVSPGTAPNPYNARDCATWNTLVLNEEKFQGPNSPTWSYIEFSVALGARTLQTNEDGLVWWSDDIECWGSRDRFPPF
jgi:hypothetical protein